MKTFFTSSLFLLKLLEANSFLASKMITKGKSFILILIALIVLVSCNKSESAIDVLNVTIKTIDTIVDEKPCFQIQVGLEDKITMPNFMTKLESKKGNVSKTLYLINKENYYPIRVKGESYVADNPEEYFFVDQRYYDIKFNLKVDDNMLFNTVNESIVGFEKIEMKPQ